MDSQPRSRAYPRAQVEIVRPTLEHVIDLVLEEFSESLENLRRRNHRPGRKAFALLAHEQCGLTQRMIAEYLDVSPSAVSQMLRAATELERKDRHFGEAIHRIRIAKT